MEIVTKEAKHVRCENCGTSKGVYQIDAKGDHFPVAHVWLCKSCTKEYTEKLTIATEDMKDDN